MEPSVSFNSQPDPVLVITMESYALFNSQPHRVLVITMESSEPFNSQPDPVLVITMECSASFNSQPNQAWCAIRISQESYTYEGLYTRKNSTALWVTTEKQKVLCLNSHRHLLNTHIPSKTMDIYMWATSSNNILVHLLAPTMPLTSQITPS